MFWYILILLFFTFLLWILLVPVILFLDTDTRQYYLVLPGIIKVVVVPTEELFILRGWVFFVPYRIHPFGRKKWKKKEPEKSPKKRKRAIKLSQGLNLLKAGFAAFRIRRLDLNLDTDDFMLNTWLIPGFSVLNSENIHLKINYNGNSSLLLDLRFRLGSLVWHLIGTKYKSFINN